MASAAARVPDVSAVRASSAAAATAPDVPGFIDGEPSYVAMVRASPPLHRAFVASAALQCACIVTERVFILSQNQRALAGDDIALREAVWFCVVIVVSSLFVCYFAVHSMLMVNRAEMAAFVVTAGILLSRLASEFAGRTEECDDEAAARACGIFLGVSIFFVAASMAFFASMYRDLAWKRYKALGAVMATARVYFLYELFAAVRMLDVQFSLITLITSVVFLAGAPAAGPLAAPALGATLALCVAEALWERAGDAFVKTESRRALGVFWALSALLPAFVVVMLVEVAASPQLASRANPASTLRFHVLAMALLAVAARAASVVVSVLLFRHFGPDYVALRRVIERDRARFTRGRVAKRAPAAPAAALNPLAVLDAEAPAGAAAGAAAAAPAGAAAAPAPAPTKSGRELPAQAPFVAPSAATAVSEWAARRA